MNETYFKNTVNNTGWAKNLWNEWARVKNAKQASSECLHIPKLEEVTVLTTEKQFRDFLKLFVFEVRSKTGQLYSYVTLKGLVLGVQRYLRTTGWPSLSLLNRIIDDNKELCDSLWSIGHQQRPAGPETKKTIDLISTLHEIALWDRDIFNMNTSKGLSYCVFYYNSKYFMVHSPEEHRDLKQSQFVFCRDSSGRYVQFSRSLTGIKHAKGWRRKLVQYKYIKYYENVGNLRCFYKVLEKYLSSISKNNPHVKDVFYFHPGYKNLFKDTPLGTESLRSYIKRIMEEGNIKGSFCNNSIQKIRIENLIHINEDTCKINNQVTEVLRKEPVATGMEESSSSGRVKDENMDIPKLEKTNNTNETLGETLSLTDAFRFLNDWKLIAQERLSHQISGNSFSEDKDTSSCEPTDKEVLQDMYHSEQGTSKGNSCITNQTKTQNKEMSCHHHDQGSHGLNCETFKNIENVGNQSIMCKGDQINCCHNERKRDCVKTEDLQRQCKYKKFDNVYEPALKENGNSNTRSPKPDTDCSNDSNINETSSSSSDEGNFVLNLGDFLPKEYVIRPKDININTRFIDLDHGEVTIQIKYTRKK